MKTSWSIFKKVLYYIMYFVFGILAYIFLVAMSVGYIKNAPIAYKIVTTLLFAFVLLMAALCYKLFVKPRKKDK